PEARALLHLHAGPLPHQRLGPRAHQRPALLAGFYLSWDTDDHVCSSALLHLFIQMSPCPICASELAARRLPVNGRGFAASAVDAEPRLQPRTLRATPLRDASQSLPSRGFRRELVAARPSVRLPGQAIQPSAAPAR